MIDRDRSYHAHRRSGNDIGGIEAATQSGFEKGKVSVSPGEGEKRGGSRNLEEGDRLPSVLLLTLRKEINQVRLGDFSISDDDSLTETD